MSFITDEDRRAHSKLKQEREAQHAARVAVSKRAFHEFRPMLAAAIEQKAREVFIDKGEIDWFYAYCDTEAGDQTKRAELLLSETMDVDIAELVAEVLQIDPSRLTVGGSSKLFNGDTVWMNRNEDYRDVLTSYRFTIHVKIDPPLT